MPNTTNYEHNDQKEVLFNSPFNNSSASDTHRATAKRRCLVLDSKQGQPSSDASNPDVCSTQTFDPADKHHGFFSKLLSVFLTNT